MSRELDLGSAFFKDEVSSQASKPLSSSQPFSDWSNAGLVARGTWLASQADPFVYEPTRGGGGNSSWFGPSWGQSIPARGSEALHNFFDGWINTLASWTQSGSATIGQHHDPFQGGFLASGSGSEPTHGGWGSSSR